MPLLFAFVIGLVFGAGLCLSGMSSPAKVLGFLDFTGSWDPSLALVMGGAVGVGLVFFRLARARLGPPGTRIDLPLVAGAAIFGIGWGLVGFCPGPAVVALGFGEPKAFVFVAAMVVVVLAWFFVGGHAYDAPQARLEDVSFESLRLGLVLAFFSFVGFESATVLGHEAQEPLRVIPRSVITTVLSIGVFFVVASYVSVAAFRGAAVGLDKADAPLSVLASGVGLGFLGPVIAAGVAASFFASALASINAGARVLYLLSRHGIFHARAGDAHQEHATPHVAVSISAVVVLVLSLPLTLGGIGFLDAFSYLGSVATFGFLVSYILVSVAAPVFLKGRGELKPQHVVASVASIALLSVPLVGVLYPVPEFPLNVLPWIFLALIGLGVGWFLIVRWKTPAVLEQIEKDLEGATPAAAE